MQVNVITGFFVFINIILLFLVLLAIFAGIEGVRRLINRNKEMHTKIDRIYELLTDKSKSDL